MSHATDKAESRSFRPNLARTWYELLRGRRVESGVRGVGIVHGLVPNRQFGSHELRLLLNARRERPVEDAAGQERPLDRVARTARMQHPFDSLEQIGKMRIRG